MCVCYPVIPGLYTYYFWDCTTFYTLGPVLRVEPGLHPARRHIPRILQALRKPTRSCALSHFPLYNWHSRHIGQVFWTPKLTQFIADMLTCSVGRIRLLLGWWMCRTAVERSMPMWVVGSGSGKVCSAWNPTNPHPAPPSLYPHNFSHLFFHIFENYICWHMSLKLPKPNNSLYELSFLHRLTHSQ